ncbi:hypothetical protein LEMLEM_LOCUS18873 [Lemmus lemmus]
MALLFFCRSQTDARGNRTPTLSHQPCPTGLSPPLTFGTTCNISRPRVHTHRSRTWPGPSLHTSLWGAPWASMSPTRRTEQCPVCCLPGSTGWSLRWSVQRRRAGQGMEPVLNKLPMKTHHTPVGFFQGADVCCITL